MEVYRQRTWHGLELIDLNSPRSASRANSSNDGKSAGSRILSSRLTLRIPMDALRLAFKALLFFNSFKDYLAVPYISQVRVQLFFALWHLCLWSQDLHTLEMLTHWFCKEFWTMDPTKYNEWCPGCSLNWLHRILTEDRLYRLHSVYLMLLSIDQCFPNFVSARGSHNRCSINGRPPTSERLKTEMKKVM